MTEPLTLRRGAHRTRNAGMCAMEAVAYIAGEPHSDHPTCACPVIAAFMRRMNDDLPDDETRTRLLGPLVPRLVGTRSTPDVERRRSLLALDWMVREYTPAWLALRPGLAVHAEALRALPEIVDIATAKAARPVVGAARDAAVAAAAAWGAAWDARWAVARAAAENAICNAAFYAAFYAAGAAWGAAWGAAEAAARDAAFHAARAARDAAAWDAAMAAAEDAARATGWAAAWDADAAAAAVARAVVWDAAWDAAEDALAPMTALVQASALALVDRMIAAG